MALQALALVQNKQYAVVKFQTEKAIEIIATKWLIADETTLKAFWPPGPYFNARQLVPKQPDPGSDWECFNVIVMQATNRYDKAIDILVDTQYRNGYLLIDNSYREASKSLKTHQKRRKRLHAQFISKSLDSAASDTDNLQSENCVTVPKKLRKSNSSKSLTASDPPQFPEEIAVEVTSAVKEEVDNIESSGVFSDTIDVSSPSIDLSSDVAGLEINPATLCPVSKDRANVFTKPDWAVSLVEDVRRIRNGLSEIRQEVQANRFMLEKILDALGSDSGNRSCLYEHELNRDFGPLPMKTMDEFDALEKKLVDLSAQKQLVKCLQCCNDDSVQATMKNIALALLTNTLMMKFNWKGQRGKRAIQTCYITKVIFYAIKNNPRTSKSTNKEITKALQDFLRYAVKRLERHNKRMDE